jgi:cell division protein ZapB
MVVIAATPLPIGASRVDYHTDIKPRCPASIHHGIDRAGQPHYIGRMTTKMTPSLIDAELSRLEELVAGLLETVERLSQENRSLRIQQDSTASERANLLEKHDQVRSRVDAIVTRLKSLETGT